MIRIVNYNKLSFLTSFFVFILSCITIYFSLSSFYYKNEKFKLSILVNSIENVLQQQFNLILLDNSTKYSAFLNYKKDSQHTQDTSPSPNTIITNENTLTINNNNIQLTLDLQELKNLIDRSLPSYLAYKVWLNDQIITVKDARSSCYLNSSALIKLSDFINFSITLCINKNSPYLQKTLAKFYKNYLVFVFFALLINVFCLSFYLFIRNKYSIATENLLQNIEQLKIKIKSLSECIEIYKKIDSLSDQLEHNKIVQITKISATELANDVKNYFHFNNAKVVIVANVNIEYIYIPCLKANFYQIIFSLVNLLIMFINDQSDEQKLLTMSFNTNQITIEFESFALDEEKMIYLANNVLDAPDSFFLVNCNLLFKLLKKYRFDYKFVFTDLSKNKIDITLSDEKVSDDAKILKFIK